LKLAWNRKPVGRDFRLRLFPAVAGAAAALLLLKAVELATLPPAAVDPAATLTILKGDPAVTGSTAAPNEKKKEEPPPPPAGTKVDLEAPATSAAEKELLERLAKRRQELEQREQDLQTRENLLKAADKKLETRIQELKNLEGNVPKTEQASEQVQAGLKNLVVMYEAMKPKDAARVFDKLSMQVLIPVVQAMNPRKMSEILAAMSPDVAGRLTVELAARSLNTPVPPPAPSAAAPGRLPAGELQAIPQKKQ
jgi:flagellar motility protein MotE (MotC chaperone)